MGQQLSSGARIGFDPQLMSEHVFKKYSDALEMTGQALVSIAHNLVDTVWASERPARPFNPLLVLSTKYSGKESCIACTQNCFTTSLKKYLTSRGLGYNKQLFVVRTQPQKVVHSKLS